MPGKPSSNVATTATFSGYGLWHETIVLQSGALSKSRVGDLEIWRPGRVCVVWMGDFVLVSPGSENTRPPGQRGQLGMPRRMPPHHFLNSQNAIIFTKPIVSSMVRKWTFSQVKTNLRRQRATGITYSIDSQRFSSTLSHLQKAALFLCVVTDYAEELIGHQAHHGQVAETLRGTQQSKGPSW